MKAAALKETRRPFVVKIFYTTAVWRMPGFLQCSRGYIHLSLSKSLCCQNFVARFPATD